jgi:2-polyprenyl-6-methoxyphenol hydroxylase-like FAD-dependent oxidoreductase
VVADVAIIGGGFAGSVLATKLAERGMSIVLIEPNTRYPNCFKAEKLEPDQWQILDKYNLLETISPVCEDIRGVWVASAGRIHGQIALRQYGYLYHDLVNQIRSRFPNSLDVCWKRVKKIVTSDTVQQLELSDNSTVRARLAVIATGKYDRLHEMLGAKKRVVSRPHSFHFGFDIKKTSGAFPFDSMTYHGHELRSGADYVTFFRTPGAMRANLFTYWKPGDERVKRFAKFPLETLLETMPGLQSVLSDFEVSSSVDRFAVELYYAEQAQIPGAVFISNAFQSACPATGTGLSKALTDVDVLLDNKISEWLETPGMGADKISEYYRDQRKKVQDRKSLRQAIKRRHKEMNVTHARWRLERVIKRYSMSKHTLDINQNDIL